MSVKTKKRTFKGRGDQPSAPRRTPRTFRTQAQLCALKRDNVTYGDYWMLVGNAGWNVVLSHQPAGEPRIASIELPRHVFNRFVDWYNDGVWPRPKKAKDRTR